MEMLRILSRLLDYPTADIGNYQAEVLGLIENAPMKDKLRQKMVQFVKTRTAMDLLDWQAEYDGMFERGRSLGLWLFEHVHGESRDRGQAMVDLVALYRQAGLEISQHELPDYIPLFLEFLATQGDDNARGWLVDMEHILALLQVRLEKRESDYAVLFEALLDIANSKVSLKEVRERIAAEKRDDTKAAIDKEWEEEEVTFGAESLEKSCDSAARRPSESQRRDLDVPLNWVGFNDATEKPASALERN
ncbi:nitrate reductase molybdenum cofactor assembly chaperone [Simiduia litorea]|uniref:nitrate reductase molybdenum cofactor assembly chaperone n=1 Tax=Simiduia litorea TaxID=1435348 RepID=UPI0036F3F41F